MVFLNELLDAKGIDLDKAISTSSKSVDSSKSYFLKPCEAVVQVYNSSGPILYVGKEIDYYYFDEFDDDDFTCF